MNSSVVDFIVQLLKSTCLVVKNSEMFIFGYAKLRTPKFWHFLPVLFGSKMRFERSQHTAYRRLL